MTDRNRSIPRGPLDFGHEYLLCAMWYVCNRPLKDFLVWFYAEDWPLHAEHLDTDPHAREMAETFLTRDLSKIFARLDTQNQRRFLVECYRVYGRDAQERAGGAR